MKKANPKHKMKGTKSQFPFKRNPWWFLTSRHHLRGHRFPAKCPRAHNRVPKASSSFLQLFVNLGYRYHICSFLCIFSQVFAPSITLSPSLGVLLQECCSEALFIFPRSELPWHLSLKRINMALFYVHWRGPVFYCWSLCQSKIEHCCWFCWEQTASQDIMLCLFPDPFTQI